MTFSKRAFCALSLAALGGTFALGAQAQNYPVRDISAIMFEVGTRFYTDPADIGTLMP